LRNESSLQAFVLIDMAQEHDLDPGHVWRYGLLVNEFTRLVQIFPIRPY
jgi:hypothetical protein